MSTQVAKLIARIAENLPDEMPSDIMQGWIDKPKALGNFLKGLCLIKNQIVPFLSIVLGDPELCNGAAFHLELRRRDKYIDGDAEKILSDPDFHVSGKGTRFDLVSVSVAELGLKDGATRGQVYGRATELGLELCPADVGPKLRLSFSDQPRKDLMYIGMKPVGQMGGCFELFNSPECGLCLLGTFDKAKKFSKNSVFVFILPKK